MDAVILCPGPSLVLAPASFPGCCVLAVNSAMDAECAGDTDWWVAHDLWKFPLPHRKPSQGMVTSYAAICEGQDHYVPDLHIFDFRMSRFSIPVRISTTAAIYWAAERLAFSGGEGTITIYGSEMEGDKHWDGTDAGEYDDWTLARADVREAINRIPYQVKGLPWNP